MSPSDPLLVVEDVTAGFGATTVLHGVTFEVQRGEIADPHGWMYPLA